VKRILIVSYLFPPLGGIGVQRALSLAKYLPLCGYEVHVLTARNAAGPVYDPDLLKSIPAGVRIHNAPTAEIPFVLRQKIWKWTDRKGDRRSHAAVGAGGQQKSFVTSVAQRILCPEPEIMWTPWAARRAKSIVNRHAIEVVLVTAPPFSAFLVGNAVKRDFPNVRLVSDFRDEWLTFYLNNNDFQNNPHARRRAPEIERETIQRSDLVVAVNESSLSEIRSRYPQEPDGKFACVPNGYDPDAFAGISPLKHEGRGVVVAHGGTVYKNATPRFYLDALDALPDEVRAQVETWFVGRIANEETGSLHNRKSVVRVFDFLPQRDALTELSKADYLLLTMTDPISIPGKLYEYLALDKPILAFTPPGSEVSRLIEETGAGWQLDPAQPQASRRMLADILARKQPAPRQDRAAVRRYERPNLVAEYSAKIETVA
jgi:hypothetical protein